MSRCAHQYSFGWFGYIYVLCTTSLTDDASPVYWCLSQFSLKYYQYVLPQCFMLAIACELPMYRNPNISRHLVVTLSPYHAVSCEAPGLMVHLCVVIKIFLTHSDTNGPTRVTVMWLILIYIHQRFDAASVKQSQDTNFPATVTNVRPCPIKAPK